MFNKSKLWAISLLVASFAAGVAVGGGLIGYGGLLAGVAAGGLGRGAAGPSRRARAAQFRGPVRR